MEWSPIALIKRMRSMREREREMIEKNPYLAAALEQEKMESHRMAVIARTFAMVVIMIFLPFVNFHPTVLFYEFLILVFIGLGWLQYRMASVGYSKAELFLILADILLLTLIFTVPNPLSDHEFPTAALYRFGNFDYFFLILAIATLAYSWRTVWAIGTWVAIIWLVGVAAIALFGSEMPEINAQAEEIYAGNDILLELLLPHALQLGVRFQEAIVFVLIAGILAIKGFRSTQLLMKQADIAAERANLSRYFPPNLVDALATTDQDVGAVRSQEVVVLFTDIVGFTKFAERNSPEEVMELLRTYHAEVEKAIFDNNGTLEKYIGDGVMATFGRPEPSAEDAANALRAANQIMEANERFNQARKSIGKEEAEISIGIHYGPVILGDIGPERRMEFAVVGDTVNVAARLESETRKLHCHCVVSDEVIKKIDSEIPEADSIVAPYIAHGELQLKGRAQPINVWIS